MGVLRGYKMVYGFYFNDSFFEVLSQLSSDLSRWRVFNCVCEYVFEGECDVQKLNKKELRVFEFILRKVNGGGKRVERGNDGQFNNKKSMVFGKKNDFGTNKNFKKVVLATNNFAGSNDFVSGLHINSSNTNRDNGEFGSAVYGCKNQSLNFEVQDEGNGGVEFCEDVNEEQYENSDNVVLEVGNITNKEIGNEGNIQDFFVANENQRKPYKTEESGVNYFKSNENRTNSTNLNENGVNSIKTDEKNFKLNNLVENQRKPYKMEESGVNYLKNNENRTNLVNLNESGANSIKTDEKDFKLNNLVENQRKPYKMEESGVNYLKNNENRTNSTNFNENCRNSMKINENHSKSASPYILIKQNKKHKNKLKLKNLKNNINKNNIDFGTALSEGECFSHAKNFCGGAPSIDDVRKEIDENNYIVDADEFYYFYLSNGWQAGKSPILDWRAKLKDWDVRKRKGVQGSGGNTKFDGGKIDDKYAVSGERKYEGKDLSALFDNLDDIVF